MLSLIKTNSDSSDFRSLVVALDADLQARYGEQQSFFSQFNKLDHIHHVIIAYENNKPIGCGAFKEYELGVAEIKRMYVKPELRGKGIAAEILNNLEQWAKEEGFKTCILETAIKQPEAIRLYEKCGYTRIPNYGQYIGVEISLCLQKELNA
ncbi:GNAT family N-acetyltransferase [Lacibacter sp.]|uniref:GNAT family N-acetyltransferase n=1 Tax=Lacibacter sp. TaxID=1915409 RepID=UPI002B4AE389|nr:GNAT family N-acetyltransferase [Lacibacter sp.]HLP36854.1 GNAT family N-acetyltransferase [Lacibacter sp.]